MMNHEAVSQPFVFRILKVSLMAPATVLSSSVWDQMQSQRIYQAKGSNLFSTSSQN